MVVLLLVEMVENIQLVKLQEKKPCNLQNWWWQQKMTSQLFVLLSCYLLS